MLLSMGNASLMTIVSRTFGAGVIFNVKLALKAIRGLLVCMTNKVLTGIVPVVGFTLILHFSDGMQFVKDSTFRAMSMLKHCALATRL